MTRSNMLNIAHFVFFAVLYCEAMDWRDQLKLVERKKTVKAELKKGHKEYEGIASCLKDIMHQVFAYMLRCGKSLDLSYIVTASCSIGDRPYVLSVHHMCALWQRKAFCQYFDTIWETNHSSFLTPTEVGGRRPLPPVICGQSDPSPLKNDDFDQYLLTTSQQQLVENVQLGLSQIGSRLWAFQQSKDESHSLKSTKGSLKNGTLLFYE